MKGLAGNSRGRLRRSLMMHSFSHDTGRFNPSATDLILFRLPGAGCGWLWGHGEGMLAKKMMGEGVFFVWRANQMRAALSLPLSVIGLGIAGGEPVEGVVYGGGEGAVIIAGCAGLPAVMHDKIVQVQALAPALAGEVRLLMKG